MSEHIENDDENVAKDAIQSPDDTDEPEAEDADFSDQLVHIHAKWDPARPVQVSAETVEAAAGTWPEATGDASG
jgi:hypothetical protein